MNAWTTDFVEDPLVAIVGELSSAISELPFKGKKKTTIKATLKKTQKAASAVARRSIPGLLRIASAGILDGKEVAEGLAAIVEEVAEDRIQAYEDGKSEIEDFPSVALGPSCPGDVTRSRVNGQSHHLGGRA